MTMAADLASALDPVVFSQRSGFDPEPWQAGVLRSTARRSMLACARQVGKTTTVSHKAGHVAIYRPGALVLIVSKAQRQSNEMLRKCRGVLARSGATGRLVRESESELELDKIHDASGIPKSTYYRVVAALLESGHLVNTGTKHRPFYELPSSAQSHTVPPAETPSDLHRFHEVPRSPTPPGGSPTGPTTLGVGPRDHDDTDTTERDAS